MVTGMETTLFSRDTEAFALEPVEVTVGREKRKKRKRKLVVDEDKIIQREQMKSQIQNYDDLVKAAVVAPPTKWRFVAVNKKNHILCSPDLSRNMNQTSDSYNIIGADNNFFLFSTLFRMLALELTAKSLFETPVSFTTKKERLLEIHSNNKTTKIPEDLIISSQEDDDEVELEDPTEILRDATHQDQTTALPELTVDTTEIQQDTVLEEEDEERFDQEHPVEDLPPLDVEMENPEDEIQVPPPFQLDVTEAEQQTLNETAVLNESSAKDTEDEDAGPEKTDAQDKRWTKRTQQTLGMLEKAMKKKPVDTPINFKDLTKKCNRKQAAYRFYTLLTLSKEKCIHVEQASIFGDIMIHTGERFNIHS